MVRSQELTLVVPMFGNSSLLLLSLRKKRREEKRREEKGLKPSKGNVRICQEAATRSFTETKYNSFHRK
jgi:hypothetical protein